jgi:hypothetical protein
MVRLTLWKPKTELIAGMKHNPTLVHGTRAPAPRMTKAAAFLLATALSLPVFVVLTLAQWTLG